MRRGPRCSWCFADYYTVEGAHAHGDHTRYARRCMRCGEREDPQSAPSQKDECSCFWQGRGLDCAPGQGCRTPTFDDHVHNRQPINRVRMAIEAMLIAGYVGSMIEKTKRAELLAESGPQCS